jgi:hypothetical protein
VESLSEADPRTLLRRTIRELVDSPEHELELASLISIVNDDDDLRLVAEQEMAPRNAHLELHLGGHKVVGHSTVAKSFGQFVSQMAESVKFTVRDISGSSRLQDELLIEAGPGSVKTVFIAPVRRADDPTLKFAEPADEAVPEEDGYSEALRRLALVLTHSNPSTIDDSALDAAISQIPTASRGPLKRALDEAQRQSWSIEGSSVHVHPASVAFLRERLSETVITHETWESTGHLDGHTWSTGTMRFIPTGINRPVVATFANTQVQLEVGKLDSRPGQEVRVTLQVVTTSGLANTRKSYVLKSISAIERSVPADLFDDGSGAFADWLVPAEDVDTDR